MSPNYSVLISVYYKEKPIYLKSALDSVLNQTLPPSEIILIKDGPLTVEFAIHLVLRNKFFFCNHILR